VFLKVRTVRIPTLNVKFASAPLARFGHIAPPRQFPVEIGADSLDVVLQEEVDFLIRAPDVVKVAPTPTVVLPAVHL
jgi:hypothetical protein